MKRAFSVALAGVLVPAALFLASCENNSGVVYSSTEPDNPLSITPAYTVLNTNDTVVSLTVESGTPPFTWKVSDGTLGGLSPTVSETRTVNYTRTGIKIGVNSITVTDDDGLEASATIKQTLDAD